MALGMTREVTTEELRDVFGPATFMMLATDAMRGALEIVEEHPGEGRAEAVRWVYCDGVIDALVCDEFEAATGSGGTVVATYTVPRVFERCLVCGRCSAQEDLLPWCGKRCRTLLRALARQRHPELDDADAVERTGRWAFAERETRRGWYAPLNRRLAIALD